ncbi:MAG TPA: magnesium/cobalt transporter CorA [bacterium]|nr:magnesium/cobalt transporter CorA [bacterium]HNT64833.1 magnesium/cobalt transporter CorA [bacterium]
MLKLIKKSGEKTGLSPGSLVLTDKKPNIPVIVRQTVYHAAHLQTQVLAPDYDWSGVRGNSHIIWLQLSGIHDFDWLEKLGAAFQLDRLVLEDIANTAHRPKSENFGEYLYFVGKLIDWDRGEKEISSEQISLVLGRDFVLSFTERERDIFDNIHKRLQNEDGRLRKSGADYLFYTLIDLLVDRYFNALEKLGDDIEQVEAAMMSDGDQASVRHIHHLKRDLLFFHRSVWPLRDAIISLQRLDTPLIDKKTTPYLRDVNDHVVQIIDTVETFRDLTSSLFETFLSLSGNRMNEVIKVLTIISTIFIPLTFLVGVYGMNFHFMPELGWQNGYFAVWGVMILLASAMLIYFKRKKWL